MATEFAVHLWGITIIPSLQLLTAPSWIAFTVHDNHHCMTIHQLTSHYYCVLLRFSVHIVNPLCTSHTWSFTKLFHILSRINLESAWCCYREYVVTCWMILVTQQAQNHQSIIMNLHAVKYSLDEWMLTDSTCLPNIHSLRWELAVGTIRVHKQEHWQSLVDTASFYVFIVHIVDSMCTSRTWSCRVKVCSTYEAKYKFMMLLSWICGKPVEWYSWANRHKTTRQLLRSCTRCAILTDTTGMAQKPRSDSQSSDTVSSYRRIQMKKMLLATSNEFCSIIQCPTTTYHTHVRYHKISCC